MSLLANHPYLDHVGFLAMAHRGGGTGGDENTLAAFQRAVDLGFRYLETDVQVTSDGVVVAFHDEQLDRVTDKNGLVCETAWSDLKKVRVGGQEAIPRLADLLSAFPEARFNIDIKTDRTLEPTLNLLEEQKALPRVCIGAFSHRRIQFARARFGARVCTALSAPEVIWLNASKFGFPGFRSAGFHSGGLCAQVPIRWRWIQLVDARFIATAHKLGCPVHVWTINEAAEMERLIDLGVDGIFTDRTARLRDVLIQKGLWRGPEPEHPEMDQGVKGASLQPRE